MPSPISSSTRPSFRTRSARSHPPAWTGSRRPVGPSGPAPQRRTWDGVGPRARSVPCSGFDLGLRRDRGRLCVADQRLELVSAVIPAELLLRRHSSLPVSGAEAGVAAGCCGAGGGDWCGRSGSRAWRRVRQLAGRCAWRADDQAGRRGHRLDRAGAARRALGRLRGCSGTSVVQIAHRGNAPATGGRLLLGGIGIDIVVSFNRNMWLGLIFGAVLMAVFGGCVVRNRMAAGAAVVVGERVTLFVVFGSSRPTTSVVAAAPQTRSDDLQPRKNRHRKARYRTGPWRPSTAWKTAQDHLLLGVGAGAVRRDTNQADQHRFLRDRLYRRSRSCSSTISIST